MGTSLNDPAMRGIIRALARWNISPQQVDQWLNGMDLALDGQPPPPHEPPVKQPGVQQPPVQQVPVQQVPPTPIEREQPKQRAPLPESTVRAFGAVSKVALESEFAEAKQFNDLMLDAVSKCPALAAHLGSTLGEPGTATVRFSGTAKDAFYSKAGDPAKGIPDRTITLPSKGKTPSDLLDGLIFETCNAEIQKEYDVLNADLAARLRTPTQDKPPLTLADYGMQKAQIESKAVLKDVQLLHEAKESGVELSHQAHRNLLAMLKTCKEMSGKTIEDYDALLDDKQGIVAYLEENDEELGKFLHDADSVPEIRDAILKAMASSPHNQNAGPADKNSLNTNDLYAYELLELMTATQAATMVIEEIKQRVALSDTVLKKLRPEIQKRVNAYDVDGGEAVDRSARNAVVLRIIADLKKFIPDLVEAEFSSVGFTDAMQEMAAKRETACGETLAADVQKAQQAVEAIEHAKTQDLPFDAELGKKGPDGKRTVAEYKLEAAQRRLEQFEAGKAKEAAAVEAMRKLLEVR